MFKPKCFNHYFNNYTDILYLMRVWYNKVMHKYGLNLIYVKQSGFNVKLPTKNLAEKEKNTNFVL